MKIQVTRKEFAQLCWWCYSITEATTDPEAHCEQCALWHVCDGKGIDEFITVVDIPRE